MAAQRSDVRLWTDIVEKVRFHDGPKFAEPLVHLPENYLGALIFNSLFHEQLS